MNSAEPKFCEYHRMRYWGSFCGHCERENQITYRNEKLINVIRVTSIVNGPKK